MPSRKITVCGVVLAATLAVIGWSQEFDTAIFRGDKSSLTLLDQVEDPAERKAFSALFKEGDPAIKRRLADEFLESYPKSWLLSHVYEMASKASIDLDELQAALEYGGKSLRLLPENPFLLVSLANVQIHRKLTDQAVSSATLALEYLDRFDRPARFSEKEWAKLEPELRASCYYVLGRAAVTEALAAAESERDAHYRKGRDFLAESRRLNASDTSAAYLLGIAHLSLRETHEAASHLADVYRREGPLKERAEVQLKRLQEQSGTAQPGTAAQSAKAVHSDFGAFVDSIGPPAVPKKTSAAKPSKPSTPANYAGSASCEGCHGEVFGSWKLTGMAQMFRPYQPENVFGDFTDQKQFPLSGGPPAARMGIEDDRHYFEFHDEQGAWQRYKVDYTIGSKWQQAYATRLPDGAIQVFPIQYSRLHLKWVNFWKVIDPPGSERADLTAFHRLTTATNYQVNCAMCHTSQLSTDEESRRPTDFIYHESGINCEMCHGPSGDHVATRQAGRPELTPADEPPIRFGKIGHVQYVSICAQCHMQSTVVDFGAKGEVNYSGDSTSFFREIASRPYPEFSRKAFYGDGRFRESTFIVESFLRSACFRKGEAHCGHCHDPHPADAASNPKSLKFRDEPDRMCLQCHESYGGDLKAHTRHEPESEGSRCTSCHMPKIMHSLLFQAGTHRIDDIPDAEMTMRFGQKESPNACLQCHEDKGATWAREQLAAW